MIKTVVDEAMQYVKTLFENEYSGHDFFHTFRVYQTATRIAKQENADLITVQPLRSLLPENSSKPPQTLTQHQLPRTPLF